MGWQHRIEEFWFQDLATTVSPGLMSPDDEVGTTGADSLLPWIFLQPYAEYLADHRELAQINGTPSVCPVCGSKPIVGVLRPEGDGPKKSLICMLCAHEWAFRRIYCPACGEEREPQMAYYSEPESAHVRVEVCYTCHTYFNSTDLTKTGLAATAVNEMLTNHLQL